MFEFLADGMLAFHALGFLAGAFFLILIGAILIGYWIYWRLVSVRVKARIIAVRSSGERRTDEEWMKQYAGSVAIDDSKNFDDIKKEFSQDFRKKPVRTFFSGLPIMLFALIPFAFFGIGAWFAYDFLNLKMTGKQAPAVIVDIQESYDSESGTMYYPVVSFRDGSGKSWRRKDRLGSGSISYSTGDKIAVYYDPDDPDRFVIDDFWRYMLFAFAFMGISSVFIGVMFFGLFVSLSDKDMKGKPAGERKKIAALKRQYYINQHYTPVYELTTPDGEIVRVDGDQADNWLANKLPGRELTVMFMPHKPDKARKPGKALFIIGLVCLAPGLFLGHLAFSQLSFSPGALAVVAAVLGFGVFKLMGKMKPRSEWLTKEKFTKEMKNFQIATESSGGYIMTPAEIRERVRILDRNALIGVPFMLLFGIGMMAGGYHLFKNMNDLSASALVAQGEVVDLNSRAGSEGGYVYYPVVEYKTLEGEKIRFEDSVGSDPPARRTGDKVMVLYDPAKPRKAIIDRGWLNWLSSIGLFLLGILLLFYTAKLTAGIAGRSMRR